ncbi:zf-MIZ-domain-containing protein [Rhizoclosmatium globosum]|uniref:Zf-MIZ-domain-containing protein n=1 Tax=Rhizoclosmatium globosum TaxID=329046 RepID=A0A1Y2CDC0_9FUNG|nr:zf-MIZ-domain-containing protein [Rhizoclosmatium globosum]|eukprot:ORY44926.1 zf-MIZ-domain-containing protein [Rhizoclosmatium globosum]
MKHITQDTPLTIKLTLPSDSKSVTSSALLLHQKLSPAESVAKLYESLLNETCLYKEPILRGLPIAPSTPRDLSALQTKAQKLPPVPTKRRQQIDTLDGISVGDTTIMFQCPLSLTRIKHPAKGRKCEHEQAFDAETFLEFNRKKDVWKCIVCSRMIEPKNLTIDLKMLRLLEKYSGADRCILKANGEYVAVDEKTDGEHKPTAGPAVGTVLILDDDEQVVERGGKRRISQVVSLLDSEDEESEGEEGGLRKKPRVEYSTLVRVEENGQIVETLVQSTANEPRWPMRRHFVNSFGHPPTRRTSVSAAVECCAVPQRPSPDWHLSSRSTKRHQKVGRCPLCRFRFHAQCSN